MISFFYGLIFTAFGLGIVLTNLVNLSLSAGIGFGLFGFFLLLLFSLRLFGMEKIE